MDNDEKKPKIAMVIDDNDLDQFVAKKLIRMSDLADQIISKWSAKDALTFLRENESTPQRLPDIIFLDIRMPEIDGFGFLEQYEKLPHGLKTKVRIVMLSSSDDPRDKQRAADNPFVYSFLSKPLSVAELKELRTILMFKNIGNKD